METIIRQAMNGHRESVKTLYEKNKKLVYFICSFLIEDQSEVDFVYMDIFNEMWKVFPQKNVEDEKEFTELLTRLTLRICQNKVFMGQPHVFKENKPEIADTECTPINVQSFEDVVSTLDTLNAPTRFIVASYLSSNFDVRKLSNALSEDEITVDAYFQDGMAKLSEDSKTIVQNKCLDTVVPQSTDLICLDTIDAITKPEKSGKSFLLPIIAVIVIIGGIIGFMMSQNKSETYIANIDVEGYGVISCQLDASVAPKTVENFVNLAESGFYDGLTFHRIIDGFMIQGGDPNGNGTGGSSETIEGEFKENGFENNLSHVRGTISMARSQTFNSASSQFFIVHEDATFLDGQYAAFGSVLSGMDIVDEICKDAKPTDNNGTIPPEQQPVIRSIKIEKN